MVAGVKRETCISLWLVLETSRHFLLKSKVGKDESVSEGPIINILKGFLNKKWSNNNSNLIILSEKSIASVHSWGSGLYGIWMTLSNQISPLITLNGANIQKNIGSSPDSKGGNLGRLTVLHKGPTPICLPFLLCCSQNITNGTQTMWLRVCWGDGLYWGVSLVSTSTTHVAKWPRGHISSP